MIKGHRGCESPLVQRQHVPTRCHGKPMHVILFNGRHLTALTSQNTCRQRCGNENNSKWLMIMLLMSSP